jgi:hypothetical protein
VQRALILFGFVSLSGACSHRAQPPLIAARASAAPAPAPPLVAASGCRAQPGTVYGDEAVVFAVEAPSPTRAELELQDAGGRSLAKAEIAAPGTFSPPRLPSGDFVLEVGPLRARCSVTVNRELSRATEAKR